MTLGHTLESMPRVDGRTRAAALRRETMRRHLIECAVRVFAERGPDGALIDDFVQTAEVARGTFYNYFSTPQDLLVAVVATLNDEVVSLIDPMLAGLQSPAERVATGSRAYLRLVTRSNTLARFVTRVGQRSGALGTVTRRNLSRDMELARRQGWFDFEDLAAAHDLLRGATMQSIEAIHSEKGELRTADRVLAMALVGLGLKRAEAERICALPLPAVTPLPGSILARVISA
jgi:AcrR family transcriptional regulator